MGQSVGEPPHPLSTGPLRLVFVVVPRPVFATHMLSAVSQTNDPRTSIKATAPTSEHGCKEVDQNELSYTFDLFDPQFIFPLQYLLVKLFQLQFVFLPRYPLA